MRKCAEVFYITRIKYKKKKNTVKAGMYSKTPC